MPFKGDLQTSVVTTIENGHFLVFTKANWSKCSVTGYGIFYLFIFIIAENHFLKFQV